MQLFSALRGQTIAKELLSRSLQRGRLHHAYLFEGPPGVGKFLTALALAQVLVCERRQPEQAEACGACSACERAILRDDEKRPRHPDIAVVARGLYDPQSIGRKTPETQEISIDQIRSVVLAHAGYGPHEGKARVFLIRSAEQLSTAAGNALLKMLEEPLPQVHFVLISDEAERLLPTLRSRTLSVRFAPLSDEVLDALLQARGFSESAEREALVLQAEGSVSRALELADAAGQEEELRFVTATLAALDESSAGSVLALSDTVKGDRSGLERHLRALSRHFYQQARAAEAAHAERDAERYQQVRQALTKLQRNAAPPLVLESLLFSLRRA